MKNLLAFAIIILLALAGGPSGAASPPLAGGRVCLLAVGVDDYKYLSPLKAAANNAALFADSLRAANGHAEITLLTDGRATRAAILAAFERYAATLAAGDRLVIYYSGHGGPSARQYRPASLYSGDLRWQTENNLYDETIFPVDAAYDLKSQITFADLAGRIKKIRHAEIAVILDCAYSAAHDWYIDAPQGQSGASSVRPRTSLRDLSMYGVTVVEAADWNETAAADIFGGKQYGIFTYYLARGLDAGVVRGGKGAVTLYDAFAYARSVTLQEIGSQHPKIYRGRNPAMPLADRQTAP
ncbi:caspase family protein [Anaeroselena agilis]|uniref:Caspase family protein n=1 Tax=Anaeroselena agilis TaxID=3063788 RepID=A0ABU3P3G3_9FIRM|nr:caspase family protein [Selenomonadales bacterium 4137-cl]